MSTPEEEALVGPIVDTVTSLLEGVLHDDAEAVAQQFAPDSLKRVGLSLFGLDAIGIPMGLAAKPHQLGLAAVEVGDGVAVVELRGRDSDEQDVSVCSVILGNNGTDWRIEDLWPVPADCDFTVESVLEPTVLFYNGQLQLELMNPERLGAVETQLVAGLQANGLGLHLLEQGVRIWRIFSEDMEEPVDAAAWAAGVHLAVLALDDAGPDPNTLAEHYGVPVNTVVSSFMEIAGRLGFEMQDDAQPAEAPRPSGLVDLSGKPIPPSGGTDLGGSGGIILPRG
ncbi:MAG: hypothetical protein JWO59_1068 [Chloroflexi bacterium]|nr:hypothetical protein [Chloroflexota bacterium]